MKNKLIYPFPPALSNYPMQLFRVVPLIIMKIKLKWLVKTKHELKETIAPGPFDYGTTLPGFVLRHFMLLYLCYFMLFFLIMLSSSSLFPTLTHVSSSKKTSPSPCVPVGNRLLECISDHHSVLDCVLRGGANHLPLSAHVRLHPGSRR